MKQLITEQDIRQGAIAGPILVSSDVIITPAALDAAYARGLKVVFSEAAAGCTSTSQPAPSSAGPGAQAGTVRVSLPSAAGRTYVVSVTAQGAQVFEPRGDALARVGALAV